MIGPLLQTHLLDVPRVQRANSAQEHFLAVEAVGGGGGCICTRCQLRNI